MSPPRRRSLFSVEFSVLDAQGRYRTLREYVEAPTRTQANELARASVEARHFTEAQIQRTVRGSFVPEVFNDRPTARWTQLADLWYFEFFPGCCVYLTERGVGPASYICWTKMNGGLGLPETTLIDAATLEEAQRKACAAAAQWCAAMATTLQNAFIQ